MPDNENLQILVITQVAVGVVASALASIELNDPFNLEHFFPPFGLRRILIVPLFASVLSQAVLLAFWGLASTIPPWTRMVGLVAGAAYLEVLFAPSLQAEMLGTATITIAVTSASLFVVRRLGVVLTRRTGNYPPGRPEAEGLRFSIRDMMAFTAAVALLSAGARTMRATHGRFLLMGAIWALCFVAVGLVALWAALGEARPQQRGPIVFALSPVLGAFFAYAADAHHAGWAYIILTMLLFPAYLLGSLLVVRSCGYRLVPRPETSPGQPSGGRLDEGPFPLGQPANKAVSSE